MLSISPLCNLLQLAMLNIMHLLTSSLKIFVFESFSLLFVLFLINLQVQLFTQLLSVKIKHYK